MCRFFFCISYDPPINPSERAVGFGIVTNHVDFGFPYVQISKSKGGGKRSAVQFTSTGTPQAVCGQLVLLSPNIQILFGYVFKLKSRIKMLVMFFYAEEIHTTQHYFIIVDAF